MTVFDYRKNAIHRAGGPEVADLVDLVAAYMHREEAPNAGHPDAAGEVCGSCYVRTGNALQALRESGVELAQPLGRAS